MGERIGGGFEKHGSDDNEPSNVVDFGDWKQSHGYSAPEEVEINDAASEPTGASAESGAAATATAENNDKLLVGQVKVEKPLLSFERLLTVGKFFVEKSLNILAAQGKVPSELANVFTFVAGEAINSKPVQSFGEKFDTYTFDDYAIEREEKKIARQKNQPTAGQA